MADFISIKLREKLYDNIQNSLYHLKAPQFFEWSDWTRKVL